LKDKVALFGGTFNPLHNGHLAVARAALAQYALKQVVFIPTGIPPLKGELPEASEEDRYRMVEAALANEERLVVSRIEVDREGPTYTIDTVRALKDHIPEGICLVMGADCLLQIDKWKESETLLRSVPLIVAPRAGVALSAGKGTPVDGATVYRLDMPEVRVSSEEIREMVRHGKTIEGWVPREVVAYIEQHGLYRNHSPVAMRCAAEDRRSG
jgi:nicotinate-nucleotide adenylyltransferase